MRVIANNKSSAAIRTDITGFEFLLHSIQLKTNVLAVLSFLITLPFGKQVLSCLYMLVIPKETDGEPKKESEREEKKEGRPQRLDEMRG